MSQRDRGRAAAEPWLARLISPFWPCGCSLRQMSFRSQWRRLPAGALESDAGRFQPRADRIRTGWEACGRELPVMPYRTTHFVPGATITGRTGSEPHVDGAVTKLRHMPRRQTPGTSRQRLCPMPLDDGLEGCGRQQRGIRPLEDTLPANR
jgi:hypothetical protein